MSKSRHHHLLYYIEKAIEYDTSKCYSRKSLKMLLSVKEQSSKVCKEFDIESFISHRTFLLFHISIEQLWEKGVFCTSRFLRMILSKLSEKDSHFLFKVYRPKMSRLANIDHAKWKKCPTQKDCISVI